MFEYLRFNWLYSRVSVHKSDIWKILRQCVSFFFFSSNFPCFFLFSQNQLKNFETRRVFRGGACFISKQRNSSIKIRSPLLASRVLDAPLFSRTFFLSFLERRLLNRLFFLLLAWAKKGKKTHLFRSLRIYKCYTITTCFWKHSLNTIERAKRCRERQTIIKASKKGIREGRVCLLKS